MVRPYKISAHHGLTMVNPDHFYPIMVDPEHDGNTITFSLCLLQLVSMVNNAEYSTMVDHDGQPRSTMVSVNSQNLSSNSLP